MIELTIIDLHQTFSEAHGFVFHLSVNTELGFSELARPGAWDETFGSEALLETFLLGLKAALRLCGHVLHIPGSAEEIMQCARYQEVDGG